jgi:hypothetical protein
MKGMTMKKILKMSIFVLAAVAVAIVFYNKQQQYECLNAKCNELKANYKNLLIEKFEPPSFRKTVTEEKKKEIADLFRKIAEAYQNEQVELMREYVSLMPTDYSALSVNDRREVSSPFCFKKDFMRCDKLKSFDKVEDFERFVRINIEAALFESEFEALMKYESAYGVGPERKVLLCLLQYKKKFAKEGLCEFEASADRFLSYWTSFIESDNGFSKRWANFIVDYNELIKFLRPDEAKTREESLKSARSSVQGLIRCGYRPKWLKEFEE